MTTISYVQQSNWDWESSQQRRKVEYDTEKLKNEAASKMFNITLQNRYQVWEEEKTAAEEHEVERDFQVVKKAYIEVAETVLGGPWKKKKPWISEESWSLIDERVEINKKILGTHSERIKGQLKAKYGEKNKAVEYKRR